MSHHGIWSGHDDTEEAATLNLYGEDLGTHDISTEIADNVALNGQNSSHEGMLQQQDGAEQLGEGPAAGQPPPHPPAAQQVCGKCRIQCVAILWQCCA